MKNYIPVLRYSDKILSTYIRILSALSCLKKTSQDERTKMNDLISDLLSYQQKNIVTLKDNEKIYYLINNIDLSLLFEQSLTEIEKNYCEKEFAKFLNNEMEYIIPNLETIIDNGDALKCFIEYKINSYNYQNQKENYFSKVKLTKKL